MCRWEDCHLIPLLPERNIREQDFPSLRIIFCHDSHSHLQTQESVGFDRRVDFIQLGSGSSCGIGILQGKSDIRGISDDKAASQLTREGRIAQYVFMGRRDRKLVGRSWKGTEYYYDYGSLDKQRHFKISPHSSFVLEINISRHISRHNTISCHSNYFYPSLNLKYEQPLKMVLPKLDTATLAPRPPPTFQDKLNRLSATINASGPALGDLFIMTLSMLLGALVIVGAVTGLLYGTGFAIFVLVWGAKKAISLA